MISSPHPRVQKKIDVLWLKSLNYPLTSIPRKLPKSHSINPITVILDNTKYQKCNPVFSSAQTIDIQLPSLPPYSLNLHKLQQFPLGNLAHSTMASSPWKISATTKI
jgi:hypothetical protein